MGTGARRAQRRRVASTAAASAVVLCALALTIAIRLTGSGGSGRNEPGDDPRIRASVVDTVVVPNAVVAHVVDGDTVDLRIGRRRARVRLIGVNTPETVDPRRGVECFGPEAKAFVSDLLPPGTPVLVERDIEPRDDYGRLLGYVYLAADGTMVNLALVEQGFAVPLRIEPNTAHADHFRRAAVLAQQERRGLWSACPR